MKKEYLIEIAMFLIKTECSKNEKRASDRDCYVLD